ncbi:hypothetical protein ECANGB1_643 [Enterospora canceri]|uniref:Uncharacterized protein n=1 Tax=Enterospora canceri TaxID=1081671 RepID=A0A1Y1S7P6_9MICR|nr:hypothetical protein ECANGB1_643 [Enterospora canceri]
MLYGLENTNTTKCALDAKNLEAFTQKSFSDLVYEAHSRGEDYYIARVQCSGTNGDPYFYCYDAKHLCKFVFEMVISAEGRRIRIKNFSDPIHSKDIMEINFFKMRYDSDTPLRAEYAGNHISFLESNVFRSKIFFQEEALDALSVNFQFKNDTKSRVVPKRKFVLFLGLMMFLVLFGLVSYVGLKMSHGYFEPETQVNREPKTKAAKNAKAKPVSIKSKRPTQLRVKQPAELYVKV